MRGALIVLAACVLVAPRGARGDAATDRARAHQLVSLLGLESQLEELTKAAPPTTLQESIARANARDDIFVALSRAGLDVDETRARLQHEEYEAKTAHDLIQRRYEDSVERWSIAAVLVGSGSTVVGTGMQYGNETVAQWGDGVAIAGAVVAAAFSVVALARHNIGSVSASIETNLLGPLFDCPPSPRSTYPDWLWRYLDTPLPGASRSIRHELLDKWGREGRLPRVALAANDRRVHHLCAPIHVRRRIDADLLDDRADMLADVRERLAGLSGDLGLVWGELRPRR